MTTKERKQIRHSLNTNINMADIFVDQVEMYLGFAENKNNEQAREYMISTLKKYRQKIADDANSFLTEIDRTIDKLS